MIHVREDFRYFTHLPGKESVIPLSRACIKAFPTKIEVLTKEKTIVLDLNLEGPVKGFTHLLNIEKSRVEVFGKAKDYFHLFFFAEKGNLFLKLHRGKKLTLFINGKNYVLYKGDKKILLEIPTYEKPSYLEKISFGSFKKPLLERSIDRTSRLYMLSQFMPETETLDLEIFQIEALLIDLFSPKEKDYEYRNLDIPLIDGDLFSLFSTYRKLLRRQVIVEEKNSVCVLSKTTNLAHAGRAINLKCKDFTIDILWKKKKVIKAIITPDKDCKKKILFPQKPKKFRLKKHPKEKGKWHNSIDEILFKKDARVFIDRISY